MIKKPLTPTERQKQIEALEAISEDLVDLSDQPELTTEQLQRAVRGRFYEPQAAHEIDPDE